MRFACGQIASFTRELECGSARDVRLLSRRFVVFSVDGSLSPVAVGWRALWQCWG